MRERTLEKKRPSDRELTAYHEAGHVLVAYLLGCFVDHCSLRATESYRGFAFRSMTLRKPFRGAVNFNPAERPPDVDLSIRLAHLYAGVVAQRLLYLQRGLSPEPIRPSQHNHDDIHIAQVIVSKFPETERKELLHSAEKQAMELLTNPLNWQTLERVAAKLLEVEELEGPALLELLSESQDALF